MTAFQPENRIPIMRIGDCLLLTIQIDLDDRTIMALKDELAERVVQDRAQGVLIDISALDVVDSFVGRILGQIAAIARFLDAETVLVGMQPAVAITLVELGMNLPGVHTALDVDSGMRLIRRRMGERYEAQ